MSKFTRLAIVAGATLALIFPIAASADGGGDRRDQDHRVLFATDTNGNLLRSTPARPGTSVRRRSPASRPASSSAASTSALLPATSTRSAATRSSTEST
jgi:hypothetical protein